MLISDSRGFDPGLAWHRRLDDARATDSYRALLREVLVMLSGLAHEITSGRHDVASVSKSIVSMGGATKIVADACEFVAFEYGRDLRWPGMFNTDLDAMTLLLQLDLRATLRDAFMGAVREWIKLARISYE